MDIDPNASPEEVLKKLIEAAEQGTLAGVAIRVQLRDGTQEEFVFGETEEQRDALLARLRRLLGELH